MYKNREREKRCAKKIGWTQKKKAPGLPLHICGLGGAFNDFLFVEENHFRLKNIKFSLNFSETFLEGPGEAYSLQNMPGTTHCPPVLP